MSLMLVVIVPSITLPATTCYPLPHSTMLSSRSVKKTLQMLVQTFQELTQRGTTGTQVAEIERWM